MDEKEKLEILAACDFSVWRLWKRAPEDGKDPSEVHGFGSTLVAMTGAASLIADGYENKEILKILTEGYRRLSDYYATVPFKRMDPEDEDFRFLFEFKERLGDLGEKVEAFVKRVRANGMKASKDWTEYKGVMDVLKELMAKNYRERVLRNYGIQFEDPADP